MLKIAHIINTVSVNKTSDLFIAQPLTFQSMSTAKNFAKELIDVSLYSAQFQEDRKIVPEYILKTADLTRSVLDCSRFKIDRKLPLIKDILDNLYHEAPNSDYLIYTNVDIALQPYFYTTVMKIIDRGHDAFTISRRTIDENLSRISDLPLMYAAIGENHPGHDCFVFKRELYPKFEFGNACIGANWIGKVIIANLINYAENFKEYKDLHLTFHIGDNRHWKRSVFSDYDLHNEMILIDILRGCAQNKKFLENPIILNQLRRLKTKLSADQAFNRSGFGEAIYQFFRKLV